MSFPKTALVKIETSACRYIFQRLLICLVVCWQVDNCLSLIDCLFYKQVWHWPVSWYKENCLLLSSSCTTSVKISEFAKIIFAGRLQYLPERQYSEFRIINTSYSEEHEGRPPPSFKENFWYLHNDLEFSHDVFTIFKTVLASPITGAPVHLKDIILVSSLAI